jgi:hypothetical protein
MNAASSETVGGNTLSVGRAPPRAETGAPVLCGGGSSAASPHQNKNPCKAKRF